MQAFWEHMSVNCTFLWRLVQAAVHVTSVHTGIAQLRKPPHLQYSLLMTPGQPATHICQSFYDMQPVPGLI
jgi:hypothetical protein